MPKPVAHAAELRALSHLLRDLLLHDCGYAQDWPPAEPRLLPGVAERLSEITFNLEELAGVQDGVENEGGGKLGAQLLQEGAAEGGFARADFSGQLDKALALANAVEQMIEGLAMLGAEK